MARPDKAARLSIFDTFKTKTSQLTGEAARQRSIISILASSSSPTENTRTAIAQAIAKRNKIPWKNIYSGIFRDFDEILIPLELVREEGRLPLKRGPKALQEKGVPYYGLTERGQIVALSFDSGKREAVLRRFLKNSKDGARVEALAELSRFSPRFVFSIFESYVRGYCNSAIKSLTPFSPDKIRQTQKETLAVYKELLEGVSKMDGDGRRAFSDFLDSAT